ncbi:uncharacterized protein TraAM80_07281 [Trypanosoma rangeli]|uniref:Trafficking protein particle complex subunit 13 N-terminal domain-containing protein n=1 Tax=Trypanosoma rangeli TaxID=5698 RepID=A0A3R7LPQ4_TRYRA|nr:uncharacterized protein TraAM80_07281 [Trypanosoma rangeli]RNF01007.1 uncharacterized protein TraAM80_07281 [Trypanosoma rangeli]|eukprot:RNF01007.1 uncharacterized protein TraAM80_07281 [Trypanosoma rangeli]
MPSRSGTVSASANESKLGSSGTKSVLSATSYVPAVLANPLSIRATVLRRPEFCEAVSPELVEEGDILFDILANPLYHPSLTGVSNNDVQPLVRRCGEAASISVNGFSSALTLPASVGKFFVGQPFRAFLTFHNAATYPLVSMGFSIDCLHPTLHRSRIVDYDCHHLEGKGNVSFTVECALEEPGQHTLDVLVTYIDIVKEARRLTWSFSIQAEKTIMEMNRVLHVIPITRRGKNIPTQLCATGPTVEEMMSNIALPTKKYVLSMCLQNVSSVPLVLVSVKLHTEDVFQVLPPPPPRHSTAKLDWSPPSWWPAGVAKPKHDGEAFRMHHACGGKDAVEDVYLRPKDKRCYYFELVIKPDFLRSLPLRHTATGVAGAVAPSNLTDVGYVEWKWCRANGDSGVERSSRVRLSHLFLQPTLDFFVSNVTPETPRVGEPTTFECVVVNYDTKKQFDLSLRVRPDLLAPSFLYAGPLLSPLGFINPRGTITFSVSLLPWQPGWVTLQGGLELCDAREPSTLLWPLPLERAQSLLFNSPTVSTSAVTDTPEPPYPPVLCELLVC